MSQKINFKTEISFDKNAWKIVVAFKKLFTDGVIEIPAKVQIKEVKKGRNWKLKMKFQWLFTFFVNLDFKNAMKFRNSKKIETEWCTVAKNYTKLDSLKSQYVVLMIPLVIATLNLFVYYS